MNTHPNGCHRVNLDTKECIKRNKGWDSFGAWFLYDCKIGCDYICVPVPSYEVEGVPPESEWANEAKKIPFNLEDGLRYRYGQHSPLILMPPEIMGIVFDLAVYRVDAISLALTCRYLHGIGQVPVRKKIYDFQSDWAGCRLVFLGGWAGLLDLPPGILAKSERAEIDLQHRENLHDDVRAWYKQRGATLSKLEHFLCEKMSSLPKTSFESKHPWVLCNLTTKEYVSKETVDDFGMGFDEFLLSRIGWSVDDDTSLRHGGNLHQGDWVGNRFEITTIDRIRDGVDGWKDVGEEMAQDVKVIWQVQYGKDWRNQVEINRAVGRVSSRIPCLTWP